jgi:hypothetical protein
MMSIMACGGGRRALAVVLALSLAPTLACSGEPMGGEGTPAGASGAPASGGAGGAGAGSAGTGIITNPSGGAGGAIEPGCPECPEAAYGLVVHGDGDDLRMDQNASDTACAVEPLRGSRSSFCGRTGIYFSACQDASEASACLSVSGSLARYTDRSGTVWTGSLTGDTGGVTPGPSGAGTLDLALTAGDRMLELTVDYAFCSDGSFIRVVCR